MTNVDINSMTAEELRALAEKKEKAAREEQRKLEEAAKEKEYAEKEKARTAAAQKRFQPVIDALTAAIKALSPKAVIESEIANWGDGASLLLRGQGYVTARAEIKLQYEKSYSRFSAGRTTGKMRISVGNYGERNSFPQKKDGSFSYDKIAESMVTYIKEQEEKMQAMATAQHNTNASKQLADALRKETKISEYYGPVSIKPSASNSSKVVVKVDLCRELTPDEARAFIKALREAGIQIKE